VAQEVRKLAEESHSSVDKIKGLIDNIQGVVKEIVPSLQDLSQEIDVNKKTIVGIAASSAEEKAAMSDIVNTINNIKKTSDELVRSFKTVLKS